MLTKTITAWRKLTKPSKDWWWLFASASIATVFIVAEPIAAAKIIDTVYSGNKHTAFLWLAIALLLIVAKSIAWIINYKIYPRVVGGIFKNLQLTVYDKVERIDSNSFNRKNKEKILTIFDSFLFQIADFADKLSTSLAGLVRVIIIMIIITTINIYVALIILAASLINALIISLINRRILRSTIKLNRARDAITEKISDCIDGSNTIRQFDLEEKMRREFYLRTEDYNARLEKNSKLLSIKDNWFTIVWGILQAGIILFLLNLVFDFKVSLPLFLIIVPYITTVIWRIESFFSLHNDSRTIYLAMQKLKTLENMSEKELLSFGDVVLDYPDYKLSLVNVRPTDMSTKPISLSIRRNQYTVTASIHGTDRKELLSVLKRDSKPHKGKVYLDNIDIFLLENKFYSKTLQVVDQTPYFFDDSIIKNLQLAERKKNRIYSICKGLGINEEIKKLPNGYRTHHGDENISEKLLFLLGLARALLAGAEILVVDYLPIIATPSQTEEIEKTIKKLIGKKTILRLSPSKELGYHQV